MHSGNLSADMVYLGMTTKICSDVSLQNILSYEK